MGEAAFSYPSSSIKRYRRTKREMEIVRQAIHKVTSEDPPMTVRQVFYQLVSRGVIEKTEAEYNSTVVRLLTDMRRAKEIPFGWIADNTRWMKKPRTYSSAEDALTETAQYYRKDYWSDLDEYVEIWLEKDALSGVFYEETKVWGVPLMVTRGYPSLSFVYEAADSIRDEDKPTFLYYFGDHDPSGIDIPRVVERGIREFAPEAEIHFERIAVSPEQISRWNLPTRPTKKTDTRSKKFQGESVEVDAITPRTLRSLVRECVDRHIDSATLRQLQLTEAAERASMCRMAEVFTG
jgi:hypothetical protein